jgi:hypothetical protein
MKTTIDLPEEILHRAKIVAAQRRTTLRELVVKGLQAELRNGGVGQNRNAALARLRKGLNLGGKPLTREQAHERR